MDKLGVIIVAAGKGKRMGTSESKQFLMLQHKPIYIHTIEKFQQMELVHSMVVVTGEQDVERVKNDMETFGLTKVHEVVAGGSERQYSVFHGLQALPNDLTGILVHDAVRPFVTADQVERCWLQAKLCGAAVLAVPVKDTIKVVNAEHEIVSTPDRSSLWAIQTPQAFRLSDLMSAHLHAQRDQFLGTDDASLVERIGITVKVVEGDYTNLKITTPEDLDWAHFLLQKKL